MKVEKVKGTEKRSQDQKEIRLVKHQLWDDMGYYVWVWEGNQFWSNFMTGTHAGRRLSIGDVTLLTDAASAVIKSGALVLGFLGITCFPIWPNFLKVRPVELRYLRHSKPR